MSDRYERSGEVQAGSVTEQAAAKTDEVAASATDEATSYGIWSSLGLGAYRYLISENALAQTSHQTRMMAQAWLVLAMTDSDTWVGVVNGIPAIPIAALTLLGGTLADRLDRRRLLFAVRLTMAALGLVAAFLVATDVVELWHIVVLGLVISVTQSLGMTTNQAIVVDIVGKPRLMSANAMYSVTVNTASFAGPAFGGLLIAAAGVEAAFVLAAGMTVVAAAFVWLMRFEQPVRANVPKTVREDFVLGAKYIWSTPVLRWLLLLAMFVTSIGMFNVTIPRMARDELGLGVAGYGSILAAAGVGGLIGAVALIAVGRRRNYAMALTGSAFCGACSSSLSRSCRLSLWRRLRHLGSGS
jgi:MFS family permease